MPGYPRGLERDYARALRRRVRDVEQATRYALDRWLDLGARDGMNERARTDSAASDADRASRIIRRVRTAYDEAYPTKADHDLVSETFKRVDGYTYRGIKREHASALGVEPLVNADTRQLAEDFISENVALIQDLPDKQLRDIEKDVLEAIANGERAESISRAIRDRSGMARRRADLIARDQMGKAVSQLNQKRMQELGFDKYIWRTVGDERVRPEHQERDGKVFSWSSPPEDGHPGEPINCRCSAEPVFADVLEEMGVEFDPEDFNQPDPEEWTTRAIIEIAHARSAPGASKSITIIRSHDEIRPGSKVLEFQKNYRGMNVAVYDPNLAPGDREFAAVDNWVHGANRPSSVLFKEAARQELAPDGVVISTHNRTFTENEVKAMREDVRALYNETQRAFANTHQTHVTLYRGVALGPDEKYSSGVMESWTSDPKVAQRFAKNAAQRYPGREPQVIIERVPVQDVLVHSGGPGWHDGAYGSQAEYIVLGRRKSR